MKVLEYGEHAHTAAHIPGIGLVDLATVQDERLMAALRVVVGRRKSLPAGSPAAVFNEATVVVFGGEAIRRGLLPTPAATSAE